MTHFRLLDHGPIALLLCSPARSRQVDRSGSCSPDSRGDRADIERVLEGGNEAVQIGAAKTAADLEAGQGRVYQHELLAVIPVELGHRLGKGVCGETDPVFGPVYCALKGWRG